MALILFLLALLILSAVVAHFGPTRYELPDRSWTPSAFWSSRRA